MQKLFRSTLLVAAVCAIGAHAASAGELVVKVGDGRATVIAKDVPLPQVLAEWARVGNTRIVNGEKVVGGPVTLELVNLPEKEALDILLRSAAGYMAAPRAQLLPGASLYDRVVILATSNPPANPPPIATPLGRPITREVMPQPLPEDDDDGEPGDQGPVPPPGMTPFPPPEGPVPADPAQTPAAPVTSPRPGMLPQQPQPTPIMPYTPGGVPRPAAPPPSSWPGAQGAQQEDGGPE